MKLPVLLAAVLAAAVVQTGLVGKMITDRASILRNGTEVRLETGFVDPRDLFRGHYVALNLRIETVSTSLLKPRVIPERGDDVWVTIEAQEDGFWRPVGVTTHPVENKVALRGTFRWHSSHSNTLMLDFPFDRYFAPKLRAKELENLRNKRQLGIVLAVLPNGEASVKGIVIDGEPIYDEPLY